MNRSISVHVNLFARASKPIIVRRTQSMSNISVVLLDHTLQSARKNSIVPLMSATTSAHGLDSGRATANPSDAEVENLSEEIPTNASTENLELLFRTPFPSPRSEISLEDEHIIVEASDQESIASSSLTSVTSIWSEITDISSLSSSFSTISITSLSSNSSSDYPETSRGGSSLSSHDSLSIKSELGYDADTEAMDKDDLPECQINELTDIHDIDAQSSRPLPSRQRRHGLQRRLINIKKSVSSTLSKLCCFCF